MIKRVKWSPDAVALVSTDGQMWRSAGTTTANVYGLDADRSGHLWFDGDIAIENEDAWTLPHPGRCVTCQAPSPCGCPGEGWLVVVHTRLPVVPDDVRMWDLSDGDETCRSELILGDPGVFYDGYDKEYRAGDPIPPCIPFKDGHPVWVDPWEESSK